MGIFLKIWNLNSSAGSFVYKGRNHWIILIWLSEQKLWQPSKRMNLSDLKRSGRNRVEIIGSVYQKSVPLYLSRVEEQRIAHNREA